ncbi:MAG: DNA alkylation repair protein [Synergistaceae bacterium]|jgi:3-methyladenine DNA glycosylase AlkD|nr:DNA alkylation repair protein [Synergistaceae bacterium]
MAVMAMPFLMAYGDGEVTDAKLVPIEGDIDMDHKTGNDIVEKVRGLLRENSDEETRIGSRRFFKKNECILAHGVKSAAVRKIAKAAFAEIRGLPKNDIFALCEDFWKSGYIEEIGAACEWSYAVRGQYIPEDFSIFEKWVDIYVNNWMACDTLCNHTIGTFIEMYPKFAASLTGWSKSKSRWKKRASAVSLIIPARKGLFLPEIFEIADTLISDPDDLVQKGYGWMLKAASDARRSEVFDFVVARKGVMPRIAFRYAIEKMPPERRAEAMKKNDKSGA